MKKEMAAFAGFLEKCAWWLALLLMAGLAAAGVVITSQLRAPETVRYATGNVLICVLGACVLAAAVYGLMHAFERMKHIHLMAVLALVWVVVTAVFFVGADTRQEVDFLYVCQAAESFANGNYSPMSTDYFNVYSYQLGTVIVLEGLVRLVPQVRVELLMQAINAVISMASAAMLCAMGGIAFGDKRVRPAAMAMYLLCLPLAVYCIHVYGTLPMLMMCSAAVLCFTLYIRRGQLRFGVLYALCAALAYMLKPNGAVVLIALLICAVLHAMQSGDWRPAGFAMLGCVLAVLLAKLVILQYEWRSGVTLREDMSMLARLVMGLQDGKRAAGWYNGYTEQFFGAAISVEQEKAVAAADLSARLGEMAADPVRACIFFVQKALSQWLEPTYGTLLYGNYCRQTGVFAQAAQALFSEESALRMALEGFMKAWQQMLYALSAIGMAAMLRRKGGVCQLVLPVAVLGGALYHMIFEAKSQYIYVYAIYLVPMAAYGLCVTKDYICRWISGRKTRQK